MAAIGVAKIILAAGADPNWQDPDGNTPMHLAIASPIVAEPAYFVQALLQAGADRQVRNAAGRTALDEAMARLAVYSPGMPPCKSSCSASRWADAAVPRDCPDHIARRPFILSPAMSWIRQPWPTSTRLKLTLNRVGRAGGSNATSTNATAVCGPVSRAG